MMIFRKKVLCHWILLRDFIFILLFFLFYTQFAGTTLCMPLPVEVVEANVQDPAYHHAVFRAFLSILDKTTMPSPELPLFFAYLTDLIQTIPSNHDILSPSLYREAIWPIDKQHFLHTTLKYLRIHDTFYKDHPFCDIYRQLIVDFFTYNPLANDLINDINHKSIYDSLYSLRRVIIILIQSNPVAGLPRETLMVPPLSEMQFILSFLMSPLDPFKNLFNPLFNQGFTQLFWESKYLFTLILTTFLSLPKFEIALLIPICLLSFFITKFGLQLYSNWDKSFIPSLGNKKYNLNPPRIFNHFSSSEFSITKDYYYKFSNFIFAYFSSMKIVIVFSSIVCNVVIFILFCFYFIYYIICYILKIIYSPRK